MTRKILRRVLPWLVLAGSFAVLCVFEWRNISDLLDSDMASDMIYANLLAKEGAFFSPNWYYSSELRVFANHLSFTPLFLLTQDWRLVRGLGSMLTYALFVASVYAPIRHTSLKRFYPLVAAAMLMPLSVTYFHYSFVGTLYTHYYILSFWLMGLTLGQSEAAGRARAWRLGLLAALSVVAGLCGLRFLLFSALPLCASALYLRARAGRKAAPRTRRLAWGSLLSLGAMAAGAAVNLLVLSRLYTFQTFAEVTYTSLQPEAAGEFLRNLLSLLGFPESGSLFSSALAAAALSLLLVALIAWACWAALRAPGDAAPLAAAAPSAGDPSLSEIAVPSAPAADKSPAAAPSAGDPSLSEIGDRVLALFFLAAAVMHIGLLSLTSMPRNMYHFLPVSVYALPLAACALRRLPWPKRARAALAGGMACLLAATSAVNSLYFSRRDITYEPRMALESLLAEGYDCGYATFWRANVLTELSGGEVEMYSLGGPYDGPEAFDNLFPWLQLKAHDDTPPAGKVFVLLSKYEGETSLPVFSRLDPSHAVYESPYLIALGYESVEALRQDAAS